MSWHRSAKRWSHNHVLNAGISAMLVVAGLVLSVWSPIAVVREQILDTFLQSSAAAAPNAAAPQVIVVDIDRATLERFGAWPWSRGRLAVLVEAIARSGPRALGVDIFLEGPDERSAGALGRQLAASTSDERLSRLASELAARFPDADRLLADALKNVPTALGLVLEDEANGDTPPPVPVLARDKPALSGLWYAQSAVGSIPTLAGGAQGHGVLVLPGDADARIRRLPLVVATSTGLRPGLALEVVRLAVGASSYLLHGRPTAIAVGSIRLRMPADGMLRLRPISSTAQTRRSTSAVRLLDDAAIRERLRGRIVLIGSSAPELGGLRPSTSGELTPSVQIQADAVEQILRGDAPGRGRALTYFEVLAALALSTAVIGLALGYSPLLAGAAMLGLSAGWFGLTFVCVRAYGILLDPLLIPGTLLAGYSAAALIAATRTRRQEAFIRHRFEQHLAPEVVRRIVAQPHLLKLEGETREITALFSDIEGFTALTERVGPAELISILDRYVEGASRIVVEHGGMVEKIVGDGLHAIFNAPLDLADHPRHALACARALHAFSEQLRHEPSTLRFGLGRTRIGLETGPVIIGDVGGGRRLDYTAHGNTMNRAARLEAANKELGSTICIGPTAAGFLDPDLLRPLGELDLRGVQEPLSVFTLWPEDADEAARQAYRDGLEKLRTDPAAAAVVFTALAQRFPADSVAAAFARRIAVPHSAL
jgi:adenylate cyclase